MHPKKLIVALLTIMLLASTSPSRAGILTTEFDGNGSFFLGSSHYAFRNFTITSTGDTSDRQSLGFGWSLANATSSILISGINTCDVLTPTRTFVANDLQVVGYSRLASPGLDLIDGPHNAAFSTWAMLSPIGPINGSASLLQWNRDPLISTSCGILVFDTGSTAATFTASITPEPTGLCFLSIAAISLWVRQFKLVRSERARR